MAGKLNLESTRAVRLLSQQYNELNGDSIEVFDRPPTALEFSRLVHISRPVVIKGFDFPALHLWNPRYLIQKMGKCPVSVAVTANGRADALDKGPDGRLYFVEPLTESMTMETLIDKLHHTELADPEIRYLQSQNGNLFSQNHLEDGDEPSGSASEFQQVLDDVPKDVPWCSEALGLKPDAVNLWIGNGRSSTSLHSDPYENIYTTVQGQKQFFLLPPTDVWALQERNYPHAVWSRDARTNQLSIQPSGTNVPPIRWSSIDDPEKPGALPQELTPIKVTLNPGETLYLPVGWWHYVKQSGFTIAVNWWYDAEFRGMSWVLLNYLRNPAEISEGNDE